MCEAIFIASVGQSNVIRQITLKIIRRFGVNWLGSISNACVFLSTLLPHNTGHGAQNRRVKEYGSTLCSCLNCTLILLVDENRNEKIIVGEYIPLKSKPFFDIKTPKIS